MRHTIAAILLFTATPLVAQQRPATTAADWAKWETLGNGELSPDGVWVAYDPAASCRAVQPRAILS